MGVAELKEVARSEGLLVTGGSDWHGPGGGTELGDSYMTGDEVPDFLAVGGMQGERPRRGTLPPSPKAIDFRTKLDSFRSCPPYVPPIRRTNCGGSVGWARGGCAHPAAPVRGRATR